MSLLIGFLVAFNSVYVWVLYRERKRCTEASVFAGLGTIGGLATGFCPLCVTGLFPLLLSLFGVSFSFASLPFKGIEVQLLAVILLLVSLWLLRRTNT